MLDLQGFISETNATNVFVIRRGVVFTPFADACLPGITRAIVLELCKGAAIDCREKNLSLAEIWTADELFTSGTLGELAAVVEVDGRRIGSGARGPVTQRLQQLYAEKTASEGEPLPE